jgi:ABC-2 type transport system ATP-binding protein
MAPARSLSGGMRRRLMVGKALVHSPPVLVLDEPTAGVDVALRQQLWDYVRLLNRNGTTVLLTTHYLQEAEALCDRIAVLAEGRIVANDTTDALFRRVDDRSLRSMSLRPLTRFRMAFSPSILSFPPPSAWCSAMHRRAAMLMQCSAQYAPLVCA